MQGVCLGCGKWFGPVILAEALKKTRPYKIYKISDITQSNQINDNPWKMALKSFGGVGPLKRSFAGWVLLDRACLKSQLPQASIQEAGAPRCRCCWSWYFESFLSLLRSWCWLKGSKNKESFWRRFFPKQVYLWALFDLIDLLALFGVYADIIFFDCSYFD